MDANLEYSQQSYWNTQQTDCVDEEKEMKHIWPFLTPSFHSVNCFKVYLILIIYIFLKIISFKPVVAVYDQILKGRVWDLPVTKSTSLNCPTTRVRCPQIPFEKITIFFFQLCHSLHIFLSRSFFWDWDRSCWKSVANQLPLHTVCFQLELS